MLRWVESVLCGQPTDSRDRTGGKPIRLAPHQQPKDREPRRLTERGQRRERMRGGYPVAARRRTDVADHRQGRLSHLMDLEFIIFVPHVLVGAFADGQTSSARHPRR